MQSSRPKQKSVTTSSLLCSLNESPSTRVTRGLPQQSSFLAGCIVFLGILDLANAFVYFKGKNSLYLLASGIGNQEIEVGSKNIYYPKVYNLIADAIAEGVCGVVKLEQRVSAISGTTIIREQGAAIFKYGSSTGRTALEVCLNDFIVKTVQEVEKQANYNNKANDNTAGYIGIAIAFLVLALTAMLVKYKLAAQAAKANAAPSVQATPPSTPPRKNRKTS